MEIIGQWRAGVNGQFFRQSINIISYDNWVINKTPSSKWMTIFITIIINTAWERYSAAICQSIVCCWLIPDLAGSPLLSIFFWIFLDYLNNIFCSHEVSFRIFFNVPVIFMCFYIAYVQIKTTFTIGHVSSSVCPHFLTLQLNYRTDLNNPWEVVLKDPRTLHFPVFG